MKRLSIFSAAGPLGSSEFWPLSFPHDGEDGGGADEESGQSEASPDLRIRHALFPVRTGAGS